LILENPSIKKEQTMSQIDLLKTRNQDFANNFAQSDLAPLPKLGMIIIACVDARVNPTL
jgi:carbonic anhydrase